LPLRAVFNIAAIIGLIPVYDRVFVPLLHRFGKKLTLLQRIGAHASGSQLCTCFTPLAATMLSASLEVLC